MNRGIWIPAGILLATACSGGVTEDGLVKDCGGQRDLTYCKPGEAAGSARGVCLSEACVALTACGAGGCTWQGPHFDLPDTNVRFCFGPSTSSSDGKIPCPGKGGAPACGSTDHCGQDAQYGWDSKNDAAARFSVATEVASEPVVTDNVTKLIWQGCAAGQSGSGCQGTATLMDWFKADSYCKQASWGGHDDWVLPDSYQHHSMTDFSRTSPAVDLTVFKNAPSKFKADSSWWWKECYWSSSDYSRDSTVAWVSLVNNGDVSQGSGTPYHTNDKQAKGWDGCYARCVRQTTPNKWQRFLRVDKVTDQPVVADAVTRLFWQACSAGQTGSGCSGKASFIDWKSSLAHCEGLSWGGHDDWRLPNIKELRSIVDLARSSPALDATVFPNTPFYGAGMTEQNAGHYWSSTARWYNSFALYVEFGSGFSHFYKQTEGRHVRCVRSP